MVLKGLGCWAHSRKINKKNLHAFSPMCLPLTSLSQHNLCWPGLWYYILFPLSGPQKWSCSCSDLSLLLSFLSLLSSVRPLQLPKFPLSPTRDQTFLVLILTLAIKGTCARADGRSVRVTEGPGSEPRRDALLRPLLIYQPTAWENMMATRSQDGGRARSSEAALLLTLFGYTGYK